MGDVNVTTEGMQFKLRGGEYNYLTKELFWHGNTNWSRLETRFFRLASPHARVVLDIGANLGFFSLVAAKINPRCRVLAVEPYSANVNVINQNVKLNSLTNIEVEAIALGSADGEIDFFIPADGRVTDVSNAQETQWLENMYGLPAVKTKVPVKTLSQLVKEKGLSSLDLIKIDVDGFELQVLFGNETLIDSFRPVFLFELLMHEVILDSIPRAAKSLRAEHQYELIEWFKKRGYTFYTLSDWGLGRIDSPLVPLFYNYVASPNSSGPIYISYSETGKMWQVLTGKQK